MKNYFTPPNFLFWLGGLLTLNLAANTLEGLPGTLFSPIAQPLGHLGLAVSLGASGHQGEGMVRDGRFYFRETGQLGTPDTAQIQEFQSGTLKFNIALGLGKFFDLGLSLPYYVDYLGDETKAQALSGHGLGDPSLFSKAVFPLTGDWIVSAGFLGTLTLPSKNSSGFVPKKPGYILTEPKNQNPYFFSSYGIGGAFQSLITLDLTRLEIPIPFRTTLDMGLGYSGTEGSGERILLGLGLEWLPLPSLAFFGNIQSISRTDTFEKISDIGKEYAIAGFGFTATGEEGIFFSVGLQKSISPRPFYTYGKSIPGGKITYEIRSQPSLAVALNLGWSGQLIPIDTDHDGIADKEDLCPTQTEDLDNFQDLDGCPEIDNDLDSIYDAQDKCPMEPEDLDGFQDGDGCNEPDNDEDGFPDLQDKCINETEDRDGFEDYDGCPDLDNDQDGILDGLDKCPVHAEDKDGFEDSDGCPDIDNDKDHILDTLDKCPSAPENFNGIEDSDGCPEIEKGTSEALPQVLEARIQLRNVQFMGNTPELLPSSHPSLDTLAGKLMAMANALVEIRGYVDANMSELEGMRLSESRAIAIRDYLISKGVPRKQVLARGMGGRDPIATNRTAAGRTQNRRVELHRLDQ